MEAFDQLRLQAFTALGGADLVRQRLMNAMSIGSPSLESEAYLLKARVKGVDNLVAKVLERREKKPTYGAGDARDIVGLRLLCLFRNDLPILVRRFLSFVEWSQRAPFSLFHGAALADSIEEVKIYATQYLNDPYVGLCVDELATFGFFQKDDPRYTGGIPVAIERKESSYSSIHIVLWANCPQLGFESRVPVEAQLRTSIEDVWGEIDHRLRYKTRQKRREEDGVDEEKLTEIEEDIAANLITLKKNLDVSSDIADRIEARIKSLDYERHPIQTNSRNISVGLDDVFSNEIPKNYEKRLKPIIGELSSLYHSIGEINGSPDIAFVRRASASFMKVQKDLSSVKNEIHAEASLVAELRNSILYHLMMERALCFYWLAALAKSLRISHEKIDGGISSIDHIRNALSLYQEVCLIDGFVRDPVLAFRIACTLELKGDYELALPKFREAVSLLGSWCDGLPNDYFRVRIPLQYGVSLWHAAESIRRRASEFGGLAFANSHRQELYREAVQVTLPLIEMDMSGISQDAPSTPQEQKLNAYNNVLDYAIAFLHCGGLQEELDSIGVSRVFLEDCLRRIIVDGVAEISHVTIADTVREAAKFFGDNALNEQAAERVRQLIENKDFSYTLPDIAYSEMKLDADRDLG